MIRRTLDQREAAEQKVREQYRAATQATIVMDIVEVEGRTIEGVKILGILPSHVQDSDFNIYVRWMKDGSVRADRSDTDRMIVAASSRKGKYAAFAMLMENLSRFFGMPVIVEADPGVSGAQVAKMVGEYGVMSTEEARRAEILPEPGTLVASMLTVGPGRPAAKSAKPKASAGDVVYRDVDGAQGVVRDVLVSGELVVDLVDGSVLVRSVDELTTDGFEIIPDVQVKRSFSKHKSTRKSRARRGGAW